MSKFYILGFIFIFSCAHDRRSSYRPYKKEEGFREKVEEGLRIVNFVANSNTKVEETMVFAKFRAIEICLGEKKKFALLLDVVDKTEKKNILRSSADTYYPSYYYGMSPYYSRYSNFGLYGGFGSSNSKTWSETIVYPQVDVLYQCADQAWGPEMIFRDVTADEMKILVKDLKGGLQVEKVLDHSPNTRTFESADVLIRANGKRIQKNFELLRLFNEPEWKKNLNVEIYREGQRLARVMKRHEISESVLTSQTEVIRAACQYEEIKTREVCSKL
jgi:hypothetical protein